MRSPLRRFIALLSFGGTLLLAADPEEVTTGFEVELDGRKEVVRSSGKIEVNGKPYNISVRELETRTFDDGTIRFEFPSALTSKKELGEKKTIWTFSGNIAHVTIFRPEKAESKGFAEQYANALKQHYQSIGIVRKSEVRLRFADREILGVRLEPNITRDTVIQDIFPVEVRGQWYIFLLQDDRVNPSNEMKRTRELLQKTFREMGGTSGSDASAGR